MKLPQKSKKSNGSMSSYFILLYFVSIKRAKDVNHCRHFCCSDAQLSDAFLRLLNPIKSTSIEFRPIK